MDNIPTVTEDMVTEQFMLLSQVVSNGTLTSWLNEELEGLRTSNPVLYKFIIERSQKFAMGAMMSREPQGVAISFALEYLILLRVLGLGFGKLIGAEKFSNMMNKWLGNDNLKGLDDFDIGKGKGK